MRSKIIEQPLNAIYKPYTSRAASSFKDFRLCCL